MIQDIANYIFLELLLQNQKQCAPLNSGTQIYGIKNAFIRGNM